MSFLALTHRRPVHHVPVLIAGVEGNVLRGVNPKRRVLDEKRQKLVTPPTASGWIYVTLACTEDRRVFQLFSTCC